MILDLFFPNRCLNCNRMIKAKELVCEICMLQIPFTHFSFLENNQLTQRCKLLFPVENSFALMNFEGGSLSQKIIHALKYGKRERVGEILANWTSEEINLGREKPDVLVSVPLHPRKLRERGYNQLHLFTEVLSKNFDIPYDHHLIKRNFYRKPQAKKDKSHRKETENLFSLTKEISGTHFLVMDDVFTTGNTMSAVVWELLKHPNNKVSVLVMAID